MVGRALVAQARVRLAADALSESCRKAGLTDPRLSRDQYNLPFALPREASAFQKVIDLVLAADKIGQIRHADRLEAALGSRQAFDRPCRDWFGNTLDLVAAEIAQMEKITEQPARGAGEDNRPRLGQCLKARRKVRRIPDQSMLPQGTLATEVTNHHQSGRDANADRERFRSACLKPRNSGNNIKSRPHGSLSIVFVRARVAKIGQYPVAPKISDEAIIGHYDTSAGGVVVIHYGVHVLRIESGR